MFIDPASVDCLVDIVVCNNLVTVNVKRSGFSDGYCAK